VCVCVCVCVCVQRETERIMNIGAQMHGKVEINLEGYQIVGIEI